MSQFEERQLSRIGVVCPICSTESIFDLNRDQSALANRSCPGCGGQDFLPHLVSNQRQEYNWITYYKRMRDTEKKATVRLYFAEYPQ